MATPLTLQVFRSQNLLRSESFSRDIIKIGRLSSAHLCLEVEKVSRIHSVIEVAPDGSMSIIDMGSVEGTFVNGKRVNKGAIAFGDEIKVGGTTIKVESGTQAAESAPLAAAESDSPGAVVDEAQRAQGFDEMQLAVVELAERLVAPQQRRELSTHVRFVAGVQHPQILDRGSAAAVVEVDGMRAVVGPQEVSGMTVAMQAQHPDVAGAIVGVAHAIERLVGDAGPGRPQFLGQPVAGNEEVPRLDPEALDVE